MRIWENATVVTAAAVLAVALGVFAATLAPTVTLVDSGELIVAAWSAGVPHPPGFPLYTMLAHLATRVPVGDVAVRVNAASALFAALAAATMALAASEIARTEHLVRRPVVRVKNAPEPVPAPAGILALAGTTAGLMLAFSRAFWSFATIAEVYTLNSLLVAAVLLVVLRWRRGALAGARDDRWLALAAGIFGLALGVHHVTVAVWAPGLAVLVLGTAGRSALAPRNVVWFAAAGLAGLSVYAYLPIAASRGPVLNWGDPDSPGRLVRHVSGWIYQANLMAGGSTLREQFSQFASIAARQWGPWWFPAGIVLAGAGAVRMARADRTLLASLGLAAAAGAAYALAYDIAEDTEAYYLPVFLVAALLAGAGAVELAGRLRTRGPAWAGAAAAIVLVVALVGNWPFANRRGDLVARDYVRNALATIEPGGMLLTEDWQLYAPLLYTIEVAGERRDVVAIDVNLLRRSWYVESVVDRYPDLAAGAGAEIGAYLEDLRAWEADPDRYARNSALGDRIDGRFRTMVLALAAAHMRTAPVYVTQDLIVADTGVARAVSGAWQAVPEGIVFRLYGDTAFHPPPALALETRSLTDGRRRTDADDVVEQKVRPAYVGMLVNRGLYMVVNGRRAEAREAADAALAIDPANPGARRLAAQLAGP